MGIIGIFLQVGILWFLITYFTRQTNASASLPEAWIVIIGTLIVGMPTRVLLGSLLGPFTAVIEILALYFLIQKVCGTPRGTSMKICGWYLGVSLLISIGFRVLAVPV